MKKISILGINIHDCSLQELLDTVSTTISTAKKKTVLYANIHVVNSAQHDAILKQALNSADIVYCDGDGIRLGAQLIGKVIPERMTGADWIDDLCRLAERRSYSLYLLGAVPGVPEKTKKILVDKHHDLIICGVHHGYFDCKGEKNDMVINDINAKKPDILLVGFGTPLQEKWIATHREKLDIPIVWAVGAVMDFISEKSKRAPEFILRNNLEWLYRLYQEPGRMWKRYVVGNVLFLLKILFRKYTGRH